MHKMKAQLVDFANFVLDRQGSEHRVTDADLSNWEDKNDEDLNPNKLPSQYQPGQALTVKPQFLNDSYIDGKVIKVHFTPGSVSYDLEIRSRNSIGDQYVFRLYNVSAAII